MRVGNKLIGVLIATAVGAGAGAALGFGPMLRYKSVGVMHVEMSTGEYKRTAELANDAQMLRDFAATTPPQGLPGTDFDKLVHRIVVSDWQTPVPKISKMDAKELPDLLIQMEQERQRERDKNIEDRVAVPTSYLGVRLSATASTPANAAAVATWLGSYFKDIATREAVRDQVSRWAGTARQFSDRAAERKLKYQFAIEQAKQRVVALKRVVAEYPDAGRRETSQVVDLRKDNEKFISPLAQLVGAESEIIESQEKIKKLEREVEQEALLVGMMDDLENAITGARSGAESVARLSAAIAAHSKKAGTEAEREMIASLMADISQITARFQSQAQFLAKPSLSDRPEQPVPLAIIIACALLTAAICGAFLWRADLISFLTMRNGIKSKSY